MKILIAVDASTHSEQALEFVSRMRWPAGSRMIVLSVMQPLRSPVPGPFESGKLEAELMDEQRRALEGLVAKAEQRLRESGFATDGRLLIGDPREALIDAAREERADLIAMGSHGRTGLSKLVLGSVSSHVVTHAPCSVLVVKTVDGNAPGSRKRRAS